MLIAITLVGCRLSNTPTTDTNLPAKPEKVTQPKIVRAPDIGLERAAGEGNVNAVRQHIAAGTDLNRRNTLTGSTALMSAAAFGQTETAVLLIEAGADLETKNYQGATALHTASFLCREEIVKVLLAKGADKTARNKAGATPLETVVGPFEKVKSHYDFLGMALSPLGLKLDYDRIKATRPKIAEMLK